ncbi:hypothetical protein EAF00_011848 [Botryotinia globosa]|nr:hypothetical protein EAF00_011848 [Botryotinia globosa]
MISALDSSAISSFRRASNSLEMNNAQQAASVQSFEGPNTSSTIRNYPDVSNIPSLREPIASSADKSAPLASSAQPLRESRVSASTQRSGTPYARRKESQLRIQLQRDGKASGQWRRIILIMDMSYMYKSIEDLAIAVKDQDLPGFIDTTSKYRELSFEQCVQCREELEQLAFSESILKRAWFSHGLCKRSLKSDHDRWGTIFQVTFCEMIPANKYRRGIWKTGAFRNDQSDRVRNWERVFGHEENNRLVLRRSCVTIVGTVDYFRKWSPEHWTMLLLTPSSADIWDIYEDGGKAVDSEFIVAFSGIIDRSTRAFIDHWDILANYFEKLLRESDTLLKPELHDLLLVDNSKYFKSKRYFWALNILKEIESDVAAVISQLEGFMDFSETLF